jgi:guanylate kinase
VKPFPIVLSAPSGGGKTTVARALVQRRSDIGYSVSCTTRAPRSGEVDGKDYSFLSTEEFQKRRLAGEFAECAEVHGKFYGTLRSEVQKVLEGGKHVLMDIDVQGAELFSSAFPETVLVFLLPPSVEVMVGRLKARGTEAPEALLTRLRNARAELSAVGRYHYVVVNDDLESTIERVSAIVDAEMVRHDRVGMLDRQVAELVEHLSKEIQLQARAVTPPGGAASVNRI